MEEFAIVIAVVTEIVEEPPPLLFDLTALQIEANKQFGFTAEETLNCAQELYEDGELTYPRTSSHNITPDMVSTVSGLLSDAEGNDSSNVGSPAFSNAQGNILINAGLQSSSGVQEAGTSNKELSSSSGEIGTSSAKSLSPSETKGNNLYKQEYISDNSYDARCSKTFSDLKNKTVMSLVPMGKEIDDSKRAPKAEYSEKEKAELKVARDAVKSPKSDTVMQKVICVDTGNVKEDLKNYLNPTDRNTGAPCDCKIYGFVSKAKDAAPFTKTPQECYDNLRLDYKETPYTNPDQPVYVVRYTGDTGQYAIPYSKEFGGNRSDGQPFTGNGYTGSLNRVIPEYASGGTTPSAGVIYRLNPDGTKQPIAYYDSKEKVFELYK